MMTVDNAVNDLTALDVIPSYPLLADSACGGAALSALGEPRILTQDMQIRYHGPARLGTIVASAEVVHQGQRTITVQCRVNQAGILIASVTATFAILSPAEMTAMKSTTQ